MPRKHARKEDLADLKEELGVKHHVAVAILDHPERDRIREVMLQDRDVQTVDAAVAILEDPGNDPLCERCGWTVSMVCPECPGCGCYNGQCSGWRHGEYQEEMDAATGEIREYECDCGWYGSGFHCCDCGANHEYHCDC
ncbi:hypothetical protein [Streptomyces luteireticuli]|uniref:Uncharacterized protein n=1 Tax=Streptomyces luteireticuli TaxID=173858 RepID=A0ABP3J6A3_9ACTN